MAVQEDVKPNIICPDKSTLNKTRQILVVRSNICSHHFSIIYAIVIYNRSFVHDQLQGAGEKYSNSFE